MTVGGCADCERFKRIIEDQAKALAEFADEVVPWAPSLACVYYLYGPTRWSDPNWGALSNKLRPVVDDLGALPAQKVTPMVWAEHVGRRKITPGESGKVPSDNTLNQSLSITKGMLNWAVRNRIPGIRFNALALAKPIPGVEPSQTAIVPADMDRLLRGCEEVADMRCDDGNDDGIRSKLISAFALCLHDSMLRFSEAMGLRHDRIGGDGAAKVLGKGKKARAVILTPRTMEAIGALPRDGYAPHVFMYRGSLVPGQTMRNWFRKACEFSGVDSLVAEGEARLRPHHLRASGATTADAKGASTKAIQLTLGHSDMGTTSIYIRRPQLEAAVEVAEKIIEATERRGPKKVQKSSRTGLTSNGRA